MISSELEKPGHGLDTEINKTQPPVLAGRSSHIPSCSLSIMETIESSHLPASLASVGSTRWRDVAGPFPGNDDSAMLLPWTHVWG